MNTRIVLRLTANPEQAAKLEQLQAVFAEACSTLGPIIRETRCWNRVTLHHLAYRLLRERFPALGSQMACNAIYSVSRSARLLFQSASSPWNIEKKPGQALPLLRFAANSPVYFDRHTLNLRKGKLSLYTLDGRLQFNVGLSDEDENRFRQEKLREVVLSKDALGFLLIFLMGDADISHNPPSELPEYVMIIDPENVAA